MYRANRDNDVTAQPPYGRPGPDIDGVALKGRGRARLAEAACLSQVLHNLVSTLLGR